MDNKGSIQYKISRLDEKLMKLYRNTLLNLMKELGINEEDQYFYKKINEMERYVTDGSAIIYIALIHNEIVGYIWGYQRKSRVHVTQFVVDENYRNNGIGNELLRKIFVWVKEHGLSGVELNVLAKNQAGLNFYMNNGFVMKHIFMVKDLDLE